MTDWFLFYYVETADLLNNSETYLLHEGILEMPEDATWEMEPDELQQFMRQFELVANYEAGPAMEHGGFVEVDHVKKTFMIVEDLAGRPPSNNTDELKELVTSALQQACYFNFVGLKDISVEELEEASDSSDSSDDTDELGQAEDSMPLDDDGSAPARKRWKRMGSEELMELDGSTHRNENCSLIPNPSGRISPMDTDEHGGSSPHINYDITPADVASES